MAKILGKSEIKVRSAPLGILELVVQIDLKTVYLHKHKLRNTGTSLDLNNNNISLKCLYFAKYL